MPAQAPIANSWLFVAAFALGTLAFACASPDKYVTTTEDGVSHVAIRSTERDAAESKAIKIARKYCDKRDKEAIFLTPNAKVEYTGSMDENTRNTIRQASKVGYVLGNGRYEVGNPDPAVGVGTAGVIGMGMTNGEDYRSTLDFRCK
ncbi:MAG: hypothetical protein JST04_10115 [Bdellovibrionales bacterium]|nr:hypothetical protein [Bdellovibrionales bacterium]